MSEIRAKGKITVTNEILNPKTMKKLIFLPLLALCFCLSAQSTRQQAIDEINQQVWKPFLESYKNADYETFMSVHSHDLVRVPADEDTILNKSGANHSYAGMFEYFAKEKIKVELDLRFFQRIADGKIASERGIYEFTMHPGTPEEERYYGKFHVILRKEAGVWKILVDYDSSEEKGLGEAFQKAEAI